MADDIFSENPVGRLTILSWLAVTSIKDGKTQRAKVYVKEFEEIISTVDPGDEEIISLNRNMYRVQQLLGNTKTAKKYLENSYFSFSSSVSVTPYLNVNEIESKSIMNITIIKKIDFCFCENENVFKPYSVSR